MNKIIIIGLLTVAGFSTAGIAETPPGAGEGVPLGPNTGTVLEVIDSSLYTYLQVSSGTGAVWLAAYRNDIAKGEAVSYTKGILRTNFHSKALNRTFDKIIFVDAVVPVRK